MSHSVAWEQVNEEFLAAALAWLRIRLERYALRHGSATRPSVEAPPAAALPPAKRRLLRFGRWPHESAAIAEPSVAPAAPVPDRQGPLVPDMAVLSAAEGANPPPTLIALARRFELTRFERDVLLLCAATELDPAIQTLCARAQSDQPLDAPTFALALRLFDNPTWEALSPARPLRYYSLIEIFQPPGTPLIRSALRADERVVSYLKGVDYLDERLTPAVVQVDVPDEDLPRSQATLVGRMVRELQRVPQRDHPPVVQLIGPDSPTKQMLAHRVAERMGWQLHHLPSELLPSQAGDLERLARLWERETKLAAHALYVDASEQSPSPEHPVLPACRLIGRCGGPIFLDTHEVLPTYGRATMVVEVERPTPGEQEGAWRAVLDDPTGTGPDRLAGQFDFGIPTIVRIARAASVAPDDDPNNVVARAWSRCLVETRTGLDALAQRIEPKATWDDIVLPKQEERLLRQIAAQVGNRSKVYETWGFADKTSRGLGISALFAGPSGTGKTMAAEVIANDLQLNLYRIDLSAVVSKYIGETEKNLARMFREAESGGVVLFFDEADALFGKRTEVRDSHDRYANIEINYLLQRIEAYRGLAILATNMRSALDAAFLRRLRFIVSFAHPGSAERKLIWQKAFPRQIDTRKLDFDRLAKLTFTGGSVFTIAMNAAFLAAEEGKSVAMRHILEAARTEARKLELPINERDYALSEEEAKA
jgi:AAA+ superfamily predicted ATPase